MREELRKGTRLIKTGDFKGKVIKSPKNRKLKGLRLSGRTLDISADGLQIQYEEELPIGTVLKLHIDSATNGFDARTFTLQAEVVRSKPSEDGYLMGLQIGKRPRKEIAIWQEYVYATLRFRNS